MELELYAQGRKLDLSNNKFEINLSSFNPLTFDDASRKYTSSIELPRSQVNDSVFFAYRNPQFVPREKILVDALISGIKIDSFRCSVTVKESGYSINLLPVSASLKEEAQEILLDNDVSSDYYDNGVTTVNVEKLIKRYYPGIVYEQDIQPKPVITTEFKKITNSNKQYKFIWETQINTINGVVSVPPFIRPESDDLNNHFKKPDDQRTATFTNCGFIAIDFRDYQNYTDYDIFLVASGVRVKLIFDRTADYDIYYNIPNFSISYDARDSVSFKLMMQNKVSGIDEVPKYMYIEINPYIAISGSEYILCENKIPIKDSYELLSGYAKMNFQIIERTESSVKMKPVLSGVSVDWSDKFSSLTSIKEAAGAAREKILSFGGVQLFGIDDSIINEKSDLTIGYPLTNEPGKSTTAIVTKDQYNRDKLQDYYNSNYYSDVMSDNYIPFTQQIEYELNMNLTLFDLLDFDSSKQVYISEFNSYFYVLSISGWSTNNGNCKVKLLKLS